MYLQFRGSDHYSINGEGLLQFLIEFNLRDEFYHQYKKDIDRIKGQDSKECFDTIETEEEILNSFIFNYVMTSVLESLFYKYPNKTKKGLVYIIEDNREEEDSAAIEWFEVICSNEEALDVIVNLIRKNNISQADVFEKIMLTS